MKFLLLIHNTAEGDATLESRLGEPGDRDATHAAVTRELRESGELLDTAPLTYERTLVRRAPAGVTAVKAQPLGEAGAIVGGYYLVDVRDQSRAVEIAGRFAEAEFAPVEVRALAL
jgi:hypothetical protein